MTLSIQPIRSVLIANRGEIACRIIRTAKNLGIRTIAIFSAADENSLHVQLADEAIFIGPARSDKSYLVIDHIVQTAIKAGADAIHPGYGFLAENAEFAEACENAGLIFIGPSSTAITAMGNKSMAKKLMESVDVPLLPGYHGEGQSDQELWAAAQAIGFPILLKAASGGGGKGMKIVERAEEFSSQLALARQEALSSFKDETLLIEKYCVAPRHVEVQIFADRYGQCIHLFDRDCSSQRRHQKVLEEAPAPGLSPTLQARMQQAAVAAAQAVDYVGAGTIEFLVTSDEQFYFMEMNTRLQVEHPVTEMITGQDLVAWQFQIAAGYPLPLQQSELTITGHAIEARICAENPWQDFLPATGTLHLVDFPQGEGLRADTGIVSGDAVTVYYDPMLAKLIAWAPNRQQAVQKLQAALKQTHLVGVKNNIPLLIRALASPDFVSGKMHTQWLGEALPELLADTSKEPSIEEQIAVAALFKILKPSRSSHARDCHSPWSQGTGWQLNMPAVINIQLTLNQIYYSVTVQPENRGYLIQYEDNSYYCKAKMPESQAHLFQLQLEKNGIQHHWSVVEHQGQLDILLDGFHGQIHFTHNHGAQTQGEAVDASLLAPMPATVVKQLIEPGDQVTKGQILLTLEAMKMQHNILAPYNGEIESCFYAVGDTVEEGSLLVEIIAT